METALGGANWLLGKVLTKLADDLVAGFVASRELGLNFEKIKTEMNFTLALLHAAQGRDFSNNSGLHHLLESLSTKANEAEDALDELHYFIIADELDGTCEATPDIGHGFGDKALHARRAVKHTAGNWFPCFSSCFSQDNPTATTKSANQIADTHDRTDSDTDGPNADKLPFNRVAMSNRIKKLIEDIHSLCDPVSKLLQLYFSSSPQLGSATTLKRPETTSMSTEEKLYGRDEIFYQTVQDIVSGRETLSILPVVGPGGIGKTTFAQHLYCHERIVEYFDARVWVCVSNSFDVHKLTYEILCSIDGGISGPHNAVNLNQLQESIALKLKAKRFFIVLDDVWTCNSMSEWNTLIAPFAKVATKGSIIIPTTRLPRIADIVMKGGKQINLDGLDSEQFWLFFEQCAFGGLNYDRAKESLTDIAKKDCRKAEKITTSYKNSWPITGKGQLPGTLESDYKFDKLEISNFWDSLGEDQNVGNPRAYYVMHDLFHELARNMSSQECINITCSGLMAGEIPPSVRHLSITLVDDFSNNLKREMVKLKEALNIEKLQTLMIFENNRPSIDSILTLKDMFQEMKDLELKKFVVKKDRVGFEVKELGDLTELGEALSICNLENVRTTEEAKEARLMDKRNIHALSLVWSRDQVSGDTEVLEGTVFRGLDQGVVLQSVQILELWQDPLSGLSLSNLFNCFTALSELKVILPVVNHEEVILIQSPLPSSLQMVHLQGWENLILPVEDGGVSKLTSLRAISISDCGQILSRWSRKEAGQIIYPFPASLKELCVQDETSMQSMGLLANLMSLTKLELSRCTNLTTDGFNPLMTINLKSLVLHGCGCVAADLLSEVARTKTLPQGAFQKLEYLEVDSIASVVVAPFCRNLSATLKKLNFRNDKWTDGFIEEQDEALQALTSLQELRFQGCSVLQSLPRGLCHLGSLKSLYLVECPQIRSLPKEVLPAPLSLLSVSRLLEFNKEDILLQEWVSQGIAFQDIPGGRYYPVTSMYTLYNEPRCAVRFNFGPGSEYVSQDFGGLLILQVMSDVPCQEYELKNELPIENGVAVACYLSYIEYNVNSEQTKWRIDIVKLAAGVT
ncbi:hypothetical protein EJB05_25106, partial [Eragrostis curvula]